VSDRRDPRQPPAAHASLKAASRLRICHLAYTFYDADNRVLRYAREMASQGHEVDVIALRRRGQPSVERQDGVRVIRIQRRSVTEKSAAGYLAKLLWFLGKAAVLLPALHLRRRYDVVHVHNVPDFLVFAAWLPKLTRARIILDIHDILPELYAGKFGRGEESRTFKWLLGVERASCSFADHVIVANDIWRAALVRRATTRCTTMLNYPDICLFKPIDPSTRRTNGRFVFLYPGSLNRHQGVDVAIKAFSAARPSMPDSEFHIYGDGPERPALTKLVQDLGLAGCVKIMDRVSLRAMAATISAADVGVVPKRAEGFGNEAFSTKILEFMASGVPVIASRTRIDEYYFDATMLRFFASGDERDLAAAMLETFQNPGPARARAEAGLKFAIRNSWQQRGGEYRQLIASLVASSSSGQAAVQ
jgi:glycosyltransferase involved in cell wall biosynthesis